MKKFLSIIVVSLLLNGNAYADQRCTQERQDWIVHLKKQLEAETEDIKWKDGMKNGQGTLTFTDGEKFDGEWLEGKFVK